MDYSEEEIKDFIEKVISHITLRVYARGKIKTTTLVKKIFKFCELYSGITFYPYQEQFSKRIIRSVLENEGAEITALFSRQSGKSEAIATTVGGLMIILPKLANMPMFANDRRLEMFKDGMWVGIFAPSQRQSKITYQRMKSRLQSKNALQVLADPDFRLEFSTSNGQTVALTNGSFATAISASDSSSIEGESFKFIIAEEAQDISDFKLLKSIHPMGAAYNSTIVKIGTATTHRGNFYEAINRNKRDFNNGKSRYKNHYEYDYKVAMKYNTSYEKYIKREKYRLGENSDEFRMSYKLHWILSRGMFIDSTKFERVNGDKERTRLYQGEKGKSYVAGIDIAKKNDSTVVTVIEVDWDNPVIVEESGSSEIGDYKAYETNIVNWLEINGDDYNSQFNQIINFLGNYSIRRLVIDSTAEGSFADRLNANLDYEVIPYAFTSKSKSELYKHLDSELKSGRAKFPKDEETMTDREYKKFIQEFLELEKEYKGQYMYVSHPPKRGAHDDYPDSWALAVFGAKEEAEINEIETVENNPFFQKQVNTFYSRRNALTARRR